MLKKIGFVVIALGVALGSTSIANAGNPLGACKACHFLDKGAEAKKSNLGPGLKGIVGRKISIDHTKFVETTAKNVALDGTKSQVTAKITGDTWTEENLDIWLRNAKKILPGTKMKYGEKKEKKRIKIIAALKEL